MSKPITELTCRICAETKPLELFRKDAKEKCGHQNICRKCRSKHRKANGETARVREATYAKRARQKVPGVSWQYITKLFAQDCVFCGVSLLDEGVVATCDHVYAINGRKSHGGKSYGGANIELNVMPACFDCNRKKGELFAIEAFDRYPEQFKPELLRPFVKRFISEMIRREITDDEVELMIGHLRDEAIEQRLYEAKVKAEKESAHV